MLKVSWSGGTSGAGGGALLAGALILGMIIGPSQMASAEGREVEFSGQLDYEAFGRAAQQGAAVRVTYSPGGTGAAALALARVKKVIVDGRCNSACAWSFVKNPGACFTPRASFGFHAAHDPGTGRRLNAATEYWLEGVRPDLRRRLAGLLVSSSLINVTASEMRAHYGDRVCGVKPKEQIASNSAQKRGREVENGPRSAAVQTAALVPAVKSGKQESSPRVEPKVVQDASDRQSVWARIGSFDEMRRGLDLNAVTTSIDASTAALAAEAWPSLWPIASTSAMGLSEVEMPAPLNWFSLASAAFAFDEMAVAGDVPEPVSISSVFLVSLGYTFDEYRSEASLESKPICGEGRSCLAVTIEAASAVADVLEAPPRDASDLIADLNINDVSLGPCSLEADREAALSKARERSVILAEAP